jgi:uncharacterized FlaG/YvyC family protein
MPMNFIEAIKELERGYVVLGDNGCLYKIENNTLYYKDENDLNWKESKLEMNFLMKLKFRKINLKLSELEKLGRKIGEFKTGDIVRHIPTGDIDEVVDVLKNTNQLLVKYYSDLDEQINRAEYSINEAELICPVEYRVDKE